MKKIVCFLFLIVCLAGCGIYRSLDLNRLTTGMTKAEVEKVAGFPDRILAVNETREGYQEVLEYRTSRGEIYALEFWDDYLTGYEYLYDDIQYIPSPYPPAVLPPFGRPIYVYPGSSYRPGSVNRPGNNRPDNVNRPNNNNNSNNNNTNSGGSQSINRPNRGSQSNRETQSDRNSENSGTGSNRTNSRTNRTE